MAFADDVQQEMAGQVFGEKPTLATVFQALHQSQHTGAVTIHFLHGYPKAIELVKAPDRIALDAGT